MDVVVKLMFGLELRAAPETGLRAGEQCARMEARCGGCDWSENSFLKPGERNMGSAVVESELVAQSREVQARLERILRRARFLEDRDRKIIELVARGTLARLEIAKLVGLSGSGLTRRVQRLVERLHHPIVAALVEGGSGLPAECRQLGVEHFLQGKTFGELADVHRMTVWEVRRMIGHIRGWAAGRAAEPRVPSS